MPVSNEHTDRPAVSSERVNTVLAEVSSVLWHVRDLLDLLVFKLEEEQLLLAAGRSRWLARATHEVEVVLEEIRHAELRRAVEVDSAAQVLGLPAAPSLRELADQAPEPWGDILRDHRAAFLASTHEVSAVAESNRELLEASYRAVKQTLSGFGRQDASATTYTPSGSAPAPQRRPLFDRAL
ncbi:MAG: hypothetical protein JWN55_1372 [Frankiales bacterium]|jgi:hypothetical protein|nr:hypothetical protein [Frankiales bacterium]